MLTKQTLIDILVNQLQESLSDDSSEGAMSTKRRVAIENNIHAVQSVLGTKVSNLRSARHLMDGFAAYMNSDTEGVYLESYYSNKMDEYVSFVSASQMRFEIITRSINYLIDHYSFYLQYNQVVYDNLLKIRMDINSLVVELIGQFIPKLRECVAMNKPISVEILDGSRLLYSSSSLNIEQIDFPKVLA